MMNLASSRLERTDGAQMLTSLLLALCYYFLILQTSKIALKSVNRECSTKGAKLFRLQLEVKGN